MLDFQAMNFEPSGESCPLCRGSTLVPRIVFAHDTDRPSDMTVLQCASREFAWQWPLMRGTEESIQYFLKSYTTTEAGSYSGHSGLRPSRRANPPPGRSNAFLPTCPIGTTLGPPLRELPDFRVNKYTRDVLLQFVNSLEFGVVPQGYLGR